MGECDAAFDEIVASMKRCAAWLREADVDFVLAGSVAAWARGGPSTCSDLDFLVRPADADRALEALVAQGLRPERPPEDWLVKVHDGEVVIDLIHEPNGLDVEESFARAETLSVMSVDMPVMAVDDIVVTKLCSFEEHYIDFVGLLPIVRALREKIDWADVRRRTAASAIATGFFAMAEALDVAPAAGAPGAPARAREPDGPRIRVSTT